MATSCVPLRSRSNYSLLTGTASVETLVARAARLGYRALALTDLDGIYGAVRFFDAARRAGVHPILGAEVTERRAAAGSGDGTAARGRAGGPAVARGAVLLARDREGYASLSCVVTERHLAPEFDLVRSLGRHAGGLHVVVDEMEMVRALRDVVPAGALWIEATPRGGCGEERVAEAARLGVRPVATGRAHLLRAADHPLHQILVAIRECGMVGGDDGSPADAQAGAPGQAAEVARGPGEAPPRLGQARGRLADPGDHLRSPREVERLVSPWCPEALANTLEIAEECDLEIRSSRPILPQAPVPPGCEESELLAALAREGFLRCYREPSPAAWRRLQEELELIGRLGFTGYFLIVAEIARFARQAGIPMVGRGSGASSLVAYVLDITSVDPIRHGLLFERFLNARRPDCPDFDLDFCWKRRDEVIEHVYETYGRDRVAMISTHATYGPRSAFRDAARAFGVPLEEVNRLARLLPHDVPEAPGEASGEAQSPGALSGDNGNAAAEGENASGVALLSPVLLRCLAQEIPVRRDPWPRILEATVAMQGFPRHLGVHCGGIVVGDRPLAELVPLEEAAKGIVVTQFEMRAIEAVGLVKIDLLGNRALSEVAETVRLVAEAGATPPDMRQLPESDAATGAMLTRGDTLGCFQIESPGMRHLMRQLHSRSLGETIDAHSLIRPGPAASGMKEEFVRRARGLPPRSAAPHPDLDHLLAATRGVMLYEEDVMRVAAWLLGGDLAEGDEIRRAITGARGAALGEVGDYLICRAVARGLSAEVAEAVWVALRRFASYSFCKAHAAGYGVLAYHTAYLKTHYPAAFAVAVMNHHQGMYPRRAHVADARRHGVRVRGPCVNASSVEWTLEEGEMRVGLAEVKGLSERAQQAICRERQRSPFTSLDDFLARVPLALPEAEALILTGALDWTGRRRPELVWELRAQWCGRQSRRSRDLAAQFTGAALAVGGTVRDRILTGRLREATLLFEGMAEDSDLAGARHVSGSGAPHAGRTREAPALADFDPEERLRYEWEFLDLWLTMHPTETRAARALAVGATATSDLERHAGRHVMMLGVPIARRRVRTRRGETMMFLTLEDARGTVECTLFPQAYARVRALLAGVPLEERLVRVWGEVEDQSGALTLAASQLETFPLFER